MGPEDLFSASCHDLKLLSYLCMETSVIDNLPCDMINRRELFLPSSF